MNGQWKIPQEKRVARASNAALAKAATWQKKRQERITTLPFDALSPSEKREVVKLDQEGKCSECGVGDNWNGKPLKLELDHINGDRKNESRENLRYVCPNCHSQTETFKVANWVKKGAERRTDDEIIEALKVHDSGYKVLKALEMNPHGGNYVRLRRIIEKYNVDLAYAV